MGNDRQEELRAHFSLPEYRRFWQEVRKKWQSFGRVGRQTIRLPDPTAEECRRIGGLIGQYFEPGKPLLVRMDLVEDRLKSSRWQVGIEVLLPLVTGQPLVSNKQKAAGRISNWEAFCETLGAEVLRAETKRWLLNVRIGSAAGSRTLKMMFEEERDTATEVAKLCVDGLDSLPVWNGKQERLPVFANRLGGDPHALDGDRTAGRLFYAAICEVLQEEAGTASEWKRDVFEKAGLLLDDVSSQVIVQGIEVEPDDPWSSFFAQSRDARVPIVLPFALLQRPIAWKSTPRVYVVENPSVFQCLLDHCPLGKVLPPLVCTSGQLSVAAWRLLQSLAEKGAEIWYSGDLDVKGIEIAIGVSKRFGNRFRSWRMGGEEYDSAPKGVVLSDQQVAMLQGMAPPWDAELVSRITKRKVAIYQESFWDLLLEDLLQEKEHRI